MITRLYGNQYIINITISRDYNNMGVRDRPGVVLFSWYLLFFLNKCTNRTSYPIKSTNFMFGLYRITTGAALFALDPYLQVTISSRTQMQSTKSQPSACVSDCGCHHDDDTSSHTQPGTNKITGKEIVFADELSELTKIMDDDTHMVLCKPKSTPGFIKKLSDQSILPEHLSFEGMVSFVVHIICRLQIMLSLMSIIYIYSRCLLYLVLWLRY